jgi:hypothetical protein
MSEQEFCVKCGKPLNEQDAFCGKCGHPRRGPVERMTTAPTDAKKKRLSDKAAFGIIAGAVLMLPIIIAIIDKASQPKVGQQKTSTSQSTHCDGTHPTSTACEECTKFALAWIQEVRSQEGYSNLQLGLPSWPDEPTTVTLVGDDISRAFVVSMISDESLITVARSQQCTKLRFWQGLVFGQHWTYSITPSVKRIEGNE